MSDASHHEEEALGKIYDAHLLRRLCFPARAKVVSDDGLREGAHAHP